MKHLKYFEYRTTGYPKIGDYVICAEYNPGSKPFDGYNELISNEVGELIDIDGRNGHDDKWVVRFNNIPKSVGVGFLDSDYDSALRFLRSEIKYFSKSKSELEAILAAKKYNL